ncbi:MAG: pyridoxamine 5'-phosphate oxidase family protein [Haloarculaceae archaeon]|jgi:hypothetical protein
MANPPTSAGLDGNRMTDEEIDALLTEVGVGVLSMSLDGVPYGLPLSFGYDGQDRLYFVFVGHSEEGRKTEYAERADVASFLAYDVEGAGDWRSVIVEGSLDRITIDDWEAARQALGENGWRPQLLADVEPNQDPRVWELEVESASGRKVEPE